MIPIAKIAFSKEEEKTILKVLRSGQIAQGREVEKFEKEFAQYLGCRYAVAVNNGTAALQLALRSIGLKKGDEVITTPFSFIASANAILSTGAKPVFIDIDEDFNLDVSKIEAKITSKTRAILAVHLFGNPCEMDKILFLARKYQLVVVEDACQAHGAEYQGKKMGSFGKLGCFSFYATKNITTGEGGMIVTNNKKLAEWLRKARNHGSSQRYYHDFLSYNFRMTDIQAALGRIQLRKLDRLNKKRRRNAWYLNENLKGIPGLILPSVSPDKTHVFHQYTVRITNDFPCSREELLKILEKKGIDFSIFYPLPIHKQKPFLELGYKDKLPVAEKMSQEVVSLPIHPLVKEKDLDYIIDTLKAEIG